jgi:hypothetical protein
VNPTFTTDQNTFSSIESNSRESIAGDCEDKMSDNERRKIDSEISETNDLFDTESDSESAGQSGDTQGLSDIEEADSESVEELAEEGQADEAEVIDAIENAPDPDVSEVRTREVPEDDVPEEYQDDRSSDVA